MKIHQGYKDTALLRGMIIGIGNFDGVHLGHQAVIREVIRLAVENDVASGLLTFEPHPLAVIGGATPPPLIYTREEKEEILRDIRLETIVYQSFDRTFADMTPDGFVEEVLVRHIKPKVVVVGHDFRFGAGGSGDYPDLEREGGKHGFSTVSISEVFIGGAPVRSSRIRDLISAGDVATAAVFLGRPYHLSGTVIRSVGVGKAIGYPTANLLPPNKLIPGDGVYAGEVAVDREVHPAAVHIGVPMKREGGRMVECHLLNFEGQLYEKKISVRLFRKIREERNFSSHGELADQIARDIDLIKETMA